MENKSAKSLTCPNCAGDFSVADLLDDDGFVTCLNCRKRFRTADILCQSNEEKVEEIRAKAYTEVEKDRTQAYREVEQGKRELERERFKWNTDKEELAEKEKQVIVFKKSKYRKWLIVFISLSLFLAIRGFGDSNTWAGIIAVAMMLLFSLAFLMGNNVIAEKTKNFRLIPTILAFAMFIPYTVLLARVDEIADEKFVWENIILYQIIPEPQSNYGYISSNEDDYLSIKIHKITENDYREYIKACKEKGFNIDAETSSSSYEAYNRSGYKIRISYYSYSNAYWISLDDPIQRNAIAWNTIEIMKFLPTPTSNIGEISYEHSNSFYVYIIGVTKEEYDSYVNECMAKGFTIDYTRNDSTFWGDNSEGYHLSLGYKGFNTVSIQIEKKDD